MGCCGTDLEAARHDFLGDWNRGAGVVRRTTEIDVVQLHHDLTDDVVARVAVEAQHDKVQSQPLERMSRKNEVSPVILTRKYESTYSSRVPI